ncbi:MAG: MOSC domain-containing protein [Ignavibacteria bacterium]|nr:MOSC domain-containing protein [Ignavibacteria bacterium]
MSIPTIQSLHIYPIKSCGSISLSEVKLDEYGFENDRRWLLLDDTGTFLTQRECPSLARVLPSIDQEFLKLEYSGVGNIGIPLQSEETTITTTSVFNSPPLDVSDEGDAASEFFGAVIGKKCRLVRRADTYRRDVSSGHLVNEGHQVNFSDSHPLLLLSTASLSDLNSQLVTPILGDRFRANIILTNVQSAFEEDTWREIVINENTLLFGKKCSRCTVTTINQQTSESSKEPLTTLSTFRRDGKGNVMFGSYFAHKVKSGVLHTGDSIHVVNHEDN